jgi:hypothetical protein
MILMELQWKQPTISYSAHLTNKSKNNDLQNLYKFSQILLINFGQDKLYKNYHVDLRLQQKN